MNILYKTKVPETRALHGHAHLLLDTGTRLNLEFECGKHSKAINTWANQNWQVGMLVCPFASSIQ